MSNISELLNLEDDEYILGVFQDTEKNIIKSNLNKNFYDISKLPTQTYEIGEKVIHFTELDEFSFQIDKKYITFKNTHIFTNKRYINLGLNFWQFGLSYQVIRNRIQIDNYILSIKKEFLTNLKITQKYPHTAVILNNLVELWFITPDMYEIFRDFLIQHWGFALEDIVQREKQYLRVQQIKYVSLCLLEIFLIFGLIIANLGNLLGNANLWFVLLVGIDFFIPVYEMFYIFKNEKMKKTANPYSWYKILTWNILSTLWIIPLFFIVV